MRVRIRQSGMLTFFKSLAEQVAHSHQRGGRGNFGKQRPRVQGLHVRSVKLSEHLRGMLLS